MLICRLDGVSKEWDGKAIFENVNLELFEGQRICLLGRNGVGKTTLLQGIMGRTKFDSGTVHYGLPLDDWGWLEQEINLDATTDLITFVQSGTPELFQVKQTLGELEGQLRISDTNDSNGFSQDQMKNLGERYGLALAEYTDAGGYEWEMKIEKTLHRLHLPEPTWHIRYADLSGGQKTRAQLARLAVRDPKVIVLDEPTNHLDAGTLVWLESWIRDYRGTVLLVSHDRAFMDTVADFVVEISPSGTKRYKGGYSEFKAQRDLELRTQQALFEKQERQRKELLEAIQRYRQWFQQAHAAAGERNPFLKKKANKNMTRFQAKEKALERLENSKVDRPTTGPRLNMEFGSGGFDANTLLTLSDVCFGYGGQPLFNRVNLRVQRQEKWAVLGPNGVGKSTLLKLMTGQLEPNEGVVTAHPQLTVGYFAQELEGLDPNETILDTLLGIPDMTQSWARTILACFLFGKEDVFKRVGDLSMGERCRVAFVRLYFSGANLLVLDEPTNYLDIDARERIETWLESYPGAVVMVSHDRYLIRRVANRILSLDGGSVTRFEGPYDDFAMQQADRFGDSQVRDEIRQLELQIVQRIGEEWPSDETEQRLLQEEIRQLRLHLNTLTSGIKQDYRRMKK